METPDENEAPYGDLRRAAFISYASADLEKAEEIVRHLETVGLPCWMAPRDVRPGREYGDEIIRGIENSRCLVLVLSAAANKSRFVRREVERAVSKGKPVLPFRIESVLPSTQLELFVSSTQWIDAWNMSLVVSLRRLTEALTGSLADPASPAIQVASSSRRAAHRVLLAATIATTLGGAMLIWRPWRTTSHVAQSAGAVAPSPQPNQAGLLTGTWDGTMQCGGKIGLRVALHQDRPGRVGGFVYSYTTVGGRRTRPQCNAALGTFDAKTGEMSIRVQPEGEPQSLTNRDGYRGTIFNGSVSEDRFAGQVDYVNGCTSFVLMRSDPFENKFPACAKTLPPNPDVGLSGTELGRISDGSLAAISQLREKWKEAALQAGDMNSCTAASIEGWAAMAFSQWLGEWNRAHAVPEDRRGKLIRSMNLAAALRDLNAYPVDAWNGIGCKEAMEKRVIGMARQFSDLAARGNDALRVIANLP